MKGQDEFSQLRKQKSEKTSDYDWFCRLFLVCKTARKYSASFSGCYLMTKDRVVVVSE